MPDAQNRKHLQLIGAIDRFNFGDLLFPMLLTQLWQGRADSLRAHGLRCSDFSAQGGVANRALAKLMRPGGTPLGSRVIIAGGEILTAQWYLMLRYLLPPGLWIPARLLERLLPPAWLNQASKRLIGVNIDAPFIIAPSDFDVPVLTAYNAVGGATFNQLDRRRQRDIANKLHQASYLSVRDQRTQEHLRALDVGLNPRLAADTGILVADMFSASELQARPLARQLRETFPNGYLCFQSARYLVRHELGRIVTQLRAIAATLNLGIVLLPLGLAAEHEDQIGLRSVQWRLSGAHLIHHTHLLDLLAVIAGARLFAGTSLHGNIVAMAYGVPHLGLTQRVPKLQAYLETWACQPYARCIDYDDLTQAAERALHTPTAPLLASRERQLEAARSNINELANTLNF
jgi:hypothetical protein